MVSVVVLLVAIAVAFIIGVAVTLFVGWYMSERFARKPTRREVEAYKQEAAELERAWSEGFDSVHAYHEWLANGGNEA